MVLELVKQLCSTTHASVALCREAAQQANGDPAQARAYLDEHWRQPKAAGEAAGHICTYVHTHWRKLAHSNDKCRRKVIGYVV